MSRNAVVYEALRIGKTGDEGSLGSGNIALSLYGRRGDDRDPKIENILAKPS